jgi:predicted Zn-dependent protease
LASRPGIVRRGLLSPVAAGLPWLAGGFDGFRERLLKEAVHELGHTPPLAHRKDYQCVMVPSHGVEWIGLKTSQFCPSCQVLVSSHSTGIARG